MDRPQSILSKQKDGLGFYYGFVKGDHRQVNVRLEKGVWVGYVHGEAVISGLPGLTETETYLRAWMKDNPDGAE